MLFDKLLWFSQTEFKLYSESLPFGFLKFSLLVLSVYSWNNMEHVFTTYIKTSSWSKFSEYRNTVNSCLVQGPHRLQQGIFRDNYQNRSRPFSCETTYDECKLLSKALQIPPKLVKIRTKNRQKRKIYVKLNKIQKR